ncbi:MAG: response regulator transcription factor [Saprospiraceae bacterium]|nr:response regulator transcription factor [Saprospiraceae bacterium]
MELKFDISLIKQHKKMIKVTIVEDDDDIRKLTASLLNFFDDIECQDLFSSAEDFTAALPTLQTDVVLMDIGLPEKNGIDCVKNCHILFPNIEFVMFTDHIDAKKVFAALSVGASGYLVKGEKTDRLADAIRDVVAGGSPMSRQISRLVTASFQRTEPQFPELQKLTEQERIVLRGLDEGFSYKEIANQRFVSENTVRSQVRSIYEKLHVHTRTEALNKLHNRK